MTKKIQHILLAGIFTLLGALSLQANADDTEHQGNGYQEIQAFHRCCYLSAAPDSGAASS